MNVVPIGGGPDSRFTGSVSQVDAYWHALQPAGEVPARSAIDPRGLEGALEYAFVLERIAPGVARFRLAGRHLNDLMGMEVRGMPTTAMFFPEARQTISDAIEETCTRPARVVLDIVSDGGIAKSELKGQMLLLPLKNELGVVSKILGCLQTNGKVGRQPRRFRITHVAKHTIHTRMPVVPPVAKEPLQPQTAGFAETQAPMTPATAGAQTNGPDTAKRPALRLVASND